MKKIIILASLVWAQTAVCNTSELSLKQATDLMFSSNPNVEAAEAEYVQAKMAAIQAGSGVLPRIALSSAWSKIEDLGDAPPNVPVTSSTGDESQSHNLVVSQTLFAGGSKVAAAFSGLDAARAAGERHKSAIAGLYYDLKTAYLNLIVSRELLSISTESVEFSKRQLSRSMQQEELGASSRIDRLFMENSLAQAMIQQEDLMLAAQSAQFALETMLDQNLSSDCVLDPIESLDIGNYVTQTNRPELKSTPAYASAYWNSKSADWNKLTSSGSIFLPNISANMSWANYHSGPFKYNSDFNNRTIGLSFSWTLFQGGSGASRSWSAWKAAEVAKANLKSAKLSTSASLNVLDRQHESALRKLDLAAQSVEIASENLSLLEQKHDLGLIAVTDLLAGELNLRQDRGKMIQARADLLKATWAIDKSYGYWPED
jgi:outer membrane protein